MPTYEYQCNKCNEEFELRRKRLDPTPVVCPACGKEDCKRLISASSFHLKGGGWFDEGYGLKDTSSKKKTLKDSDSDSGSSDASSNESTSSEKSSDAKPAKDSAKSETSSKTSTKTEKNDD